MLTITPHAHFNTAGRGAAAVVVRVYAPNELKQRETEAAAAAAAAGDPWPAANTVDGGGDVYGATGVLDAATPSKTLRVDLFVIAVNDAPVLTTPFDAISTFEDEAVAILRVFVTDVDVDTEVAARVNANGDDNGGNGGHGEHSW
jgi:hypothetical protein